MGREDQCRIFYDVLHILSRGLQLTLFSHIPVLNQELKELSTTRKRSVSYGDLFVFHN